jgi:hypothetical protein
MFSILDLDIGEYVMSIGRNSPTIIHAVVECLDWIAEDWTDDEYENMTYEDAVEAMKECSYTIIKHKKEIKEDYPDESGYEILVK